MSSTLRRKLLKGMTFLGAAGMFPTVANAQINAKAGTYTKIRVDNKSRPG
jgi:hypothetical protein